MHLCVDGQFCSAAGLLCTCRRDVAINVMFNEYREMTGFTVSIKWLPPSQTCSAIATSAF